MVGDLPFLQRPLPEKSHECPDQRIHDLLIREMLRIESKAKLLNSWCQKVVLEQLCASSHALSAFNTHDLARASESLRLREGMPRSRAGDLIAHWRRGENPIAEPDATISRWAAGKGLEAAVWTKLPPKFAGIDGRIPTEAEVIVYLQALEGETQAAGEEYVRRAPRQIATAYRRAIERALGWIPIL